MRYELLLSLLSRTGVAVAKILFVHQNFPGQYRHLAPALVANGHDCRAVARPGAPGLSGIPLDSYVSSGVSGADGLHSWLRDLQAKCHRGEAVGRQILKLLDEGFRPDLVIGHPGWGELIAIKDVLPGVPVLHQVEFVYQQQGADAGFDLEFSSSDWLTSAGLRLRRSVQLLALHDLDHGLAPTHWQASTVPEVLRHRLSVIHEGIDTKSACPSANAFVRLRGAGLIFRPGDEVVSFVARQLEPYRGFHVFMRMLPLLQTLRPNAHVVIVGGDGVTYGLPPESGLTWRQQLLLELEGLLDLPRIHFVGRIPHSVLHNLFQVTACHVYLTYPFVLSWSMLEAMSCGAVVVGSATPPVQEVISDGGNGLLVDFFDHEAMAARIAAVLADPAAHRPLGVAARDTVRESYDLNSICLPRQQQLVEDMLAGHTTLL